jgi:ABC-type lipoprotein release transport system permease subunit
MFFVPLAQRVDYRTEYRKMIEQLSHLIQGMMLVTDLSPGDLEPILRKMLAEADPNLTIINVIPMQQVIDRSFDRERVVARLAQVFGIVALALTSVGVYGLMAYMVAQQTNEIGIRMALGADRGRVIRLVLRRAFQRVVVGLLLGLPLAAGAARLTATQLYGVSFWDPFALAVAASLLTVCAIFAAMIPAARAGAISPMIALRTD